jgi:hypothetical protein
MINKRVYIVCLLIVTIVFFSGCTKKEKQKVASSSTVPIQSQIPTTTVKETSNPTNNSSDTVKETSNPTNNSSDTVTETPKPANNSSNTVAESLKPTPGKLNLDLYKKETALFHCVVLDSIATKGNAAFPALAFSNNYVNIITGEKKQGLNQKYFEDYYKDNNIYKVDDVSKLVDFKKMETVMYDEIMKSPEKYFVNNKANFKFEKMDVLVIVPPADRSPLKDGWIGVYREENNKRKMVAGSF